MIKPASLRAALAAACPWLSQNPENLHVFVEDGNVRSTMSGGLSSEYNYTLTVIITDYADNPDLLFIPIVAWLRWQQPDMLENFDKQQENFAFNVDYLDHDKCDIEIKLKDITERVRVSLRTAVLSDGNEGDEGSEDDDEDGQGESGSNGSNEDSAGIPIPVPDGLTAPGVLATITHLEEPPIDPYARVGAWKFWIEDVPEATREYPVHPLAKV